MARPQPRLMQVKTLQDISRNMRRITLGGESLRDYPTDQQGGYIKLILPNAETEEASVRTYTIRYQRESACEIDVDFVLHGDEGPASKWAMEVVAGESLMVGGPGAKKMVDMTADWFFLIGDMTALPALSVNLEALPQSAKGYAVIEILHEDDKQDIAAPPGMEMHWLVTHQDDAGREAVMNLVRSRPWLEGRPAVWGASEFETMRALRQYFKKERKLPTSSVYLSSYWKKGVREDEHKVLKKRDADTE